MKKVLEVIWLFCSYIFVPQRRPKEIETLLEIIEHEIKSFKNKAGTI